MAALCNRAGHYISAPWFLIYFLSSIFFFPRLISAVTDWMCTILLHRMQVWNVLHAAGWKYRTQKERKKWPSAHHRKILSGYIFATNISSTCSHNMVNFGPLTAETGWRVRGILANFNGVRVLASLLQRHRSTEVHQTLHHVWPSAGLVYYTYIFRGSWLLTEFCNVQNSLCV